MSKRTDSAGRATINVTPAVLAKLNDYQQRLLKRRGRRTTHGDIIGALLDGTPLWQANLMLESYRPPVEDSIEAESEQ